MYRAALWRMCSSLGKDIVGVREREREREREGGREGGREGE